MSHTVSLKPLNFSSDDLANTAKILTSLSALFSGAYAAYKNRKPKQDDKKTNLPDILKHPIFTKTNVIKNNISYFDGITNEGRESMFILILETYIEKIEKYIKILYNDYEEGLIKDKYTLRRKIYENSERFMNEFYSFYTSLSYLDSDEILAIRIVLKHYKEWNNDTFEDLLDRVDEICLSDLYPTVFNALVSFFDSVLIMISNIVKEFKYSAKYINGDLNGLKFKGVEL